MKKIDMENWERRELYEFFSGMSYPFYSVTFQVDVTELYQYVKREELSFYYALVWLCTKAFNRVENFRYTIREKEVWLLDKRMSSFTDLKKGATQFHIVTMPCGEDLPAFCHEAKAKSAAQTSFVDATSETDELIYFSCLPWIELTGLTNERDFDPDDSVPRIAWGKYTEEQGRKKLGISLELNHRFTDGYHVGQFYKELMEGINRLNAEKTAETDAVVRNSQDAKELEKQFQQDMISIYTRAKKECGYTANRFLQMVTERGGVAAAKALISKPGGTDGFAVLWERRRLDLSVEAYVLKPEYQMLFTDDERKMCRERLKQFE